MACTQVLDDSTYGPAANTGKVKAGVLFINGLRYDIWSGENVIGRDEHCDIVISSAAISTRHAVIEIEDSETHLIYDTGSTNKTRLRKFIMKPHVRYNLQNGDEIMFANVKATYTKWTDTICDSDTGSETGSESEINFNYATSFNKNRNSKTDVETLCGSFIDETNIENDTATLVNKSVKGSNASSDFKSDNDSTLCSSARSSLYTPLFQRVKNIGNLPHNKNKPDKTVDDAIENISMLSVGAPSCSKQMLQASKVNEIPESDDDEEEDGDEDDFCILSQKTRSVQKKKLVNIAQQNICDKSFKDDSVDFFDETNIFRTENKSTPGLSFVSLPVQSRMKSNVNCEDSFQDISQCESQSLLTDSRGNVCSVTHTNDERVVNITGSDETQVPLNKTTVNIEVKEEDETLIRNHKSNATDSSCTVVDDDETQIPSKTITTDDVCTVADENDEIESQSLLAENAAESVLNVTLETVSHADKKSDNIKSLYNFKKSTGSVSGEEGGHNKSDVDHKKNVSIFDLDTQLPQNLDDNINVLYDAETQALVNQLKSRFGNKQLIVRNRLKEIEYQSCQVSTVKKTSEHSKDVRNLSQSGGHSLAAAVHENEGDSAFDVDTQLPEKLSETTCNPEIQKYTSTTNKDNSIFDVDTQLPEEFEDVPKPQMQENVTTGNQLTEDKLSKDVMNDNKKQQNKRNDNSIFEQDTQSPLDINTDDIHDMDTQILVFPNKAKLSELKLLDKTKAKDCDVSKIKSEESNLDSKNKLDMSSNSDNKYSGTENLLDPFKMPSSTKRVSLSNKKREMKTSSGNQGGSLIEENCQESGYKRGLFNDGIEKPLYSSKQETVVRGEKNLTEAKLPVLEEAGDDIADELTQKLIILSKNNSVSMEIDDVKSIQNCNVQDMSDELTQKLPTTKPTKFSRAHMLIENVSLGHTDAMNKKMDTTKSDEDISDELTQKISTEKLNKIPKTSTSVLIERLYKNNTSKCDDENISDELTQKFVTLKGKHVTSTSNKVLEMQSRKWERQVNKIEESNEDMSDELTQKLITPKNKLTTHSSNKILETLSKNSKEQEKRYDEDLSEELTQKIEIPKGKHAPSASKLLERRNRNLKDRMNVIQEDISNKLTQKLITPKSKHSSSVHSKIGESPSKYQKADAKGCDRDLSDELTQIIVKSKGEHVRSVSNKLLETRSKNQEDRVDVTQGDISDEMTQKIAIANRKKVSVFSDKKLETSFKEQSELANNLVDLHEEDISDELTQKMPIPKGKVASCISNKLLESVNRNRANTRIDQDNENEKDLSDELTQRIFIQKGKRIPCSDNKSTKSVNRILLDQENKQEKCEKEVSRVLRNKIRIPVDEQVPSTSSESDSKKNKVQKKEVVEISKHEGGQKRSNQKQANKTEKHEVIISDNICQRVGEVISNTVKLHFDTKNVPSQIGIQLNKTLTISLDRDEVKNKVVPAAPADSSKLKNKLDLQNANGHFSVGNKKQTNRMDGCNPPKENNSNAENNKMYSFDDSDSDATDLEEIFVEEEVKKFKEKRISDYFKKHNSDEENKTTRHLAELKMQKCNNNNMTPTKMQSDKNCAQSDSPSPFALPSLANIKKAENEYYETLSPLKIPDHIRSIDEEINGAPSTTSSYQRPHRVRRNIKKDFGSNKMKYQSEILDEKSTNKRVNKTKSDNSKYKSNKTVQKTPGSVNKKEKSACSIPQTRINTSAADVPSKSGTVGTETKSKSSSKNDVTHRGPSDKSNSTRVSKRKLEKQLNDVLINEKNKTTLEDSCEDNNLNNKSALCTNKSPSHDKIITRSNSKKHTQRESKKDKNKRSHSPNVNADLKSKSVKLLKTEEVKLESYESPMPDRTCTKNSHFGKAGMSRRVTRQMNKGKDNEKNVIKSNELNKNKDSHKTETDLNTSDKMRRKRNLESTSAEDVCNSKIKKLADSSDPENSAGIKIVIRRSQNENNSCFLVSKLINSRDSKKAREVNTSINYDNITDAGSNTDSSNIPESGNRTTDYYNVRKSKRILQNKMANLTATKSILSNVSSSHRRSPRFSGNKTLFNDSEERQAYPATTQIQSSNRRSQSHTCERVLFTGMSDPKLDTIIKELGGAIADSPQDCTVLVTDKVRRTVKMLCAVAQGKPIVTPNWIVKSQAAGHFLDPWQHVIVDSEAEKKYNFQLQKVLTECKQRCKLEGYSVHITSSVQQPSIPEVKTIIESCKAKVLEKVPSKWPEKSFIISCIEDKSVWKKLERKSVLPPVVATETLLSGVFHNRIDFDYHRLY